MGKTRENKLSSRKFRNSKKEKWLEVDSFEEFDLEGGTDELNARKYRG